MGSTEERRAQFVRGVSEMAGAVWDFTDIWGFTYEDRNKGRKEIEVLDERWPILAEEVKELGRAIVAKDSQNIDEEIGDVLWVAIGNLLAIAHPDARHRITELTSMENLSKNHENYAIREDTGKLISIHKPEKWIGAEKQLTEEWEARGIVIEKETEDLEAPTVREAMIGAMEGLNKVPDKLSVYAEVI